MQDSAPQVDTAPTAPSSDAGTGTPQQTTDSLPPEPTGTETQPTQTSPTSEDASAKGVETPDTASDFSVPEQYQVKELADGKKQNAWVEKVGSVEDLWKVAANAQELIGRRHPTPDFENATPQEIEQYFSEVRPADKNEYNFETTEDYQPSGMEENFASLLHDNGITLHQGNKVIEGFQAIMAERAESAFDADAFMTQMETAFGNGHEMKVAQTKAIIEGNLNDQQKQRLEGVPNQYLQVVYELANNMAKNYGVDDTGKAGEHRAGHVAPVSVEQTRADLRKKIHELDKTPYHTGADKQKLIDELHATYSNKK